MSENKDKHHNEHDDHKEVVTEVKSEVSGLIGADEVLKQEGMNWFTLRVASNKESSVQATLLRKIKIEGMQHLVGR